jgi:ABC-type antimicrobial peptide transport system permease subunit
MRLSVFQGTILISARDFTARFPSEEGYRMFLIDAPADRADALRGMLSRKLDGVGLDVSASAERLAEFYGVQSTYLGMFLVLGGLGLVLGSVGMGIVVLRNVLERRGELGLLRAVGFSRADVHRLLMWEHGLLLAAGLVCGTVSAIVAVLPSLASPSVRVPYGFLGAILVGVVVSGGLWAYGATVFATRGSLVTALRNE